MNCGPSNSGFALPEILILFQQNEVTREQSYDTFVPKKNLTKAAGKGRLPKPTTGARVDTGLRKRIHEAKGGRGAKKGPDNKSGIECLVYFKLLQHVNNFDITYVMFVMLA